MMTAKPSRKPNAGPRFSVRLGHAFRRYLVAGLATLFPVLVTIYLILMIFRFADGLLGQYIGFRVPGLGLVLTIGILLAVGFLSTRFIGRVVFPTLEVWFGRLPFVNKIYPAVKQLAQFLFNEGGRPAAFRRVVLVEYPRPGVHALGFVTNETETSATGTPRKILTLLIPTPPSPFSGPIAFIPEDEVIQLTMSVEDAVMLIVSGGVVSSPLQGVQGAPSP